MDTGGVGLVELVGSGWTVGSPAQLQRRGQGCGWGGPGQGCWAQVPPGPPWGLCLRPSPITDVTRPPPPPVSTVRLMPQRGRARG